MADSAPEVLEGGCHCGAIRYRVTVRSRDGVECNCTMCAKKGYLHLIVPEEDFELLTQEDCFYCGRKPESISRGHEYGEYIYNGIDRIDNKKGYNVKNCVTCCSICNRMKMNLEKEEFLLQIKKIYKHVKKI